MNLTETISNARDSITVKRVYGEPYERNGVTVIPAATVMGVEAAAREIKATDRRARGGGFGLRARPVGAYVIRGEEVSWRPAVDLNRVILGCELLGLAAILLTHRRRARRR